MLGRRAVWCSLPRPGRCTVVGTLPMPTKDREPLASLAPFVLRTPTRVPGQGDRRQQPDRLSVSLSPLHVVYFLIKGRLFGLLFFHFC